MELWWLREDCVELWGFRRSGVGTFGVWLSIRDRGHDVGFAAERFDSLNTDKKNQEKHIPRNAGCYFK